MTREQQITNRAHLINFIATFVVLLIAILVLIIRDVRATPPPESLPPVVPDFTPVALPAATSTLTNIPTSTAPSVPLPQISTKVARYIEVTDGCAAHFEGECLVVRSGPDTTYPAVAKLRNGVVLKISETVTQNGRQWHKIMFDEWLRYPERVKGSWYIAADYVTVIEAESEQNRTATTPTSTKRIIVDRSEQKLYAYDGDNLFMTATTSTGLDGTPTPRGTFTIYRKTPTRYMQGPLPNLASDQYYDLPGVPWNLYFTEGGAVIHGAYWHDKFGTQYSHGCVNLAPAIARIMYDWATLNTTVVVQD